MDNIKIEPCPRGKGRTKVANEQEWKRAKAKAQRYSRKYLPEYPKCGHKTKTLCCSLLTMTDVRKFNESFYKSKSKIYQDMFVLKHCVANKPKRVGTKIKDNVKNKPKAVSVKYFVRTSKGTIPVCKNAFLTILGVGKNRVQRIIKDFFKTGVLPAEHRGGDRVSQKTVHKRQAIKIFIKSLTCCETHYARNKTVVRRYLPCELNIVKLWKIYNSGVEEQLKVKQCYFRNIFVRQYNIGFGSPKVDVCSQCLQFSEKMKKCTDPKEKINLLTAQRVHKLRSKAFYDLLRECDNKTAIFSFDCQRNLPLPKIPDQACYFSMQINLYNFTVVAGHSKSRLTPENVKSFIWTEIDRQRSSNEIVSAVFYTLQNFTFEEDIEQVRLVADGCGGQNKNSTMVGMAQFWLQYCSPPHIKRLELVFPIVGHSFLPPDRVFGQIEKKVKRCTTVIDPVTYTDIIKEYATVLRMGEDYSVYDWKREVEKVLKAPGSWHFRFQPAKRIIFSKSASGSVLVRGEPFYKNDIGVDKGICKRGKTITQIRLQPLSIGRTLNPDKIKSILALLVKHYDANWMTDNCLYFFRKAFNNESTNTAENQLDEEDDSMVVFSDNENDALRV